MRILIVPASPKTSRATIQALLRSPNNPNTPIQIRGLYRNLDRIPAEFQDKDDSIFEPYRGDLTVPATLNFHGFDTVFFVLPPCFDGGQLTEWATTASTNIRLAIQRSGTVKRLVLLSSMGAELEGGTGEIMTNHISEEILRDAACEVVIIRCAYFMENWATSLPTVRQKETPYLETVITPVDFAVPMVAVEDIGVKSAECILSTERKESKPYVIELHGPREYASVDVRRAFEKVLGRAVELRPVEKENLTEYFAGFLPEAAVGPFVEMTLSFLPGGVMHNDLGKKEEVRLMRGRVELEEVVAGLVKGEEGE
ncbi:NAD(P)-binding protein [Aspergillus saccharolyticus JOP 1030-1]|uniref:NAD(P)-binding protein n=1 Tax=Aspergillus saccharolyticus JOP 1030-1 TaxID=1450539 RepID=A0A319A1Z9_9EURO|nr:NAD(P)-binding protein [Aspergillus saccharolyticus JOP 1030-1]PYH46298.1 NAD(P)-binding protein [Aspergillus saccharolyticus JOP 1030-1]